MSRSRTARCHSRSGGARTRGAPRGHGDAGGGLIGTIGGVTVFLALLLFAVQLLVNLYAASMVTSAAYEGAREVAGARVDHADPIAMADARDRAEAHVRDLLGHAGAKATFDWSQSTPERVALRVRADAPRFLWPGLRGDLGFDHLDRTVEVRVEDWR